MKHILLGTATAISLLLLGQSEVFATPSFNDSVSIERTEINDVELQVVPQTEPLGNTPNVLENVDIEGGLNGDDHLPGPNPPIGPPIPEPPIKPPGAENLNNHIYEVFQ